MGTNSQNIITDHEEEGKKQGKQVTFGQHYKVCEDFFFSSIINLTRKTLGSFSDLLKVTELETKSVP